MNVILKNLLIESPQDFFKLLKDRKFIVEQSIDLIRFCDFMDLYYNGCNCNRDDYYNKVLKIYKTLNKVNTQVINDLKNSIPCDKIIFMLSNTFIFEI